MAFTKRYVKYMVSLRCKMILKDELEKANLTYSISPHGAIEFREEITETQLEELNKNLLNSGLELLDENESMLIDRIINTVTEVVHYSDKLPNLSFDDIIGKKLGSKSESILKVFSDVKGVSIMQFIVLQKVERVKELLLYEDLSLEEIAERLRYKNKQYLIAQFKKNTGLSPTYFKKIKNERMSILQNA
ncbi:helix-turn-helix domain-containing protein [Fodinibius sp. AD559]|uniref:helix-turn-helix domain-containing protein n=1 Tax=Fodinibius sp. AD559 TaxID=3424179 RepID=UPI0040468C63